MKTPSNPQCISGRGLKQAVADLLRGDDAASAVNAICGMPARRVVGPLFGLFCARDRLARWRAVTAMGAVVDRLADENLESARVVMRRFIWNLNEESGGIGWGCPEAMGESMARHSRLAEEYGGLLISYLRPECNYIDHPPLQQGVLWGLGRLAHARPGTAAGCGGVLVPFLGSEDAALRGLAAWVAGPVADAGILPHLAPLADDEHPFPLYRDGHLSDPPVGVLAREAIRRIEKGGKS